jgi:hypothetical protein
MLWQLIRPLAYVSASAAILSASWLAESCSAAMMIGDPVALSTLVGTSGGEIVVGDKKFTQFSYTFTGDMPDAAGVNVVPIIDDEGNFGIRFQGFFTDLASTIGGSDAQIDYTVMVTNSNYLISDAHLQGNPTLGTGTERHGLVQVVETFLPLGQFGEHTLVISDDEALPTPRLVAWTDFDPPVPMLRVQKDIGVLAVAGNPSPSISFIDQTYSQIIIPEPATALLMFIGIVAAAGPVRRRSAKLCG